MRRFRYFTASSFALLAALALFVGCDSADKAQGQSGDSHDDHADHDHSGHDHDDHAGHDHDDHAGHDHSHAADATGPRGGHLIELGHEHEFHVELVEDMANGAIAMYVLDSHLKDTRVDVNSLSMNFLNANSVRTFELPVTNSSDKAGNTRFESTDAELLSIIQDAKASGRLRVIIGGVAYVGQIAQLDHSGHNHD